MRDARPYGLMAAVLLATKIEQQRGRTKPAPKPQKPMTEVEAWNAAVDQRKAEKKARKDTK